MKVLAFYLSQYHIIPENDEWWGKGNMERTAVRRGIQSYLIPISVWYKETAVAV